MKNVTFTVPGPKAPVAFPVANMKPSRVALSTVSKRNPSFALGVRVDAIEDESDPQKAIWLDLAQLTYLQDKHPSMKVIINEKNEVAKVGEANARINQDILIGTDENRNLIAVTA